MRASAGVLLRRPRFGKRLHAGRHTLGAAPGHFTAAHRRPTRQQLVPAWKISTPTPTSGRC